MATWCRVQTGGGPASALVQGEMLTVVDGSPFERSTPTGVVNEAIGVLRNPVVRET